MHQFDIEVQLNKLLHQVTEIGNLVERVATLEKLIQPLLGHSPLAEAVNVAANVVASVPVKAALKEITEAK